MLVLRRGKTTHHKLDGDKGTVWACDRAASRKLKENTERLQLQSIQIFVGDSRDLYQLQLS